MREWLIVTWMLLVFADIYAIAVTIAMANLTEWIEGH